jgi:isopenicillin N synthase-like dioxygenase
MKQIPLLDFLLWKENPELFAQQLGQAFNQYGFVRIINHSIDSAMIDNLLNEANTFFNKSLDEKSKLIQGDGGQTGYVPPRSESAKGSKVADLKEFYHFRRNENPLINSQPTFFHTMQTMFAQFELMSIALMEATALSLDLDKSYFTETLQKGDSLLRVLFYPSITEDPGDAVRAEAHEDINLITLLIGANARGLQVLDTDGIWIDIEPSKDELIVNASDMLHRLTNGQCRSVTHRVINPPQEEWHLPRISIPFFCHPESGLFTKNPFDLTPLPHCVEQSKITSMGPIDASQFLAIRLYELGLIPDYVMIESIKR